MAQATPKGVRDFLPEQKILRQNIVTTLTKAFERFGFNPLETPALELYEVIASKYAGGEEILKETYKLTDQGNRELALRYDLTVPFARVIAGNKSLKFPFKRYAIDRVWRDGPIKLGRYREFWQCDADVAGAKGQLVEAELLGIAQYLFAEFNLDAEIVVNNRKVLDGILEYAGIDKDRLTDAILSIDKLKKIGYDGVVAELAEKTIGFDDAKLKNVLSINGSNAEVLAKLREILGKDNEGVNELDSLWTYCELMDISSVRIDISLARGLSYYTGTIFEGFLLNNKITSSICAGGRYDSMIGQLAGSNQDIPAVGISFGLDVLSDAIDVKQKSVVQVYVVPINEQREAAAIATQLRNAGINVDMDLGNRGLSKNLKFAQYYDIPYVIIVGEDEVASSKYTLKNMESGESQNLTITEIISALQ